MDHPGLLQFLIILIYLGSLLTLGLLSSRLFKGTRMPGQYGSAKTTVRNQKLVRIDAENNLLLIGGSIPGPNGSYVVIKQTNKL